MLGLASGERAVARCDHLGTPSYSDSDGLFRAWLTPAHRAALDTLVPWMGEAGMTARIDPAGNLIGRYEGQRPDAPALLIGSHIDSVRDAGRYDGPLGIMLGIECVAAFHVAGRRLPFAIEVIAFGDEEGSRFPTAMLTSRAVAGSLDRAALDIADGAGCALADALAAFGLDPDAFLTARRPPSSAIAYLEAHIEQGPVLEAEGLPVGIVTGIAAQARFAVTIQGAAGHAGTSAMPLRRDALAAAAECVLAVERLARAARSGLVATVGRLTVAPGEVNVVPGQVGFSIDLRAPLAVERDAAAAGIEAAIRTIADDRGVTLHWAGVHDLPASPCNEYLMTLLDAAVLAQGIAPRRIMSGAGHDAMALAALCPTAMLFIRCAGGISHNPAESVTAADAGIALAVMTDFIDRLAEARA